MTHGSYDVPRGLGGRRWTLGVLLLALGACGSPGAPGGTAVEGVPVDARESLTCEGEVYAHGRVDYRSGPAQVEGTPERALDEWLVSDPVASIPPAGYRRAGGAYDRVAFTFEDGVVAVVLDSALRDPRGEQGWGVASWAQCDPSEMSEEASSAAGFQVWEDVAGERVPAGEVESYRGADRCDQQDLTFLTVAGTTYVGGESAELRDRLRATFDPDAELPARAVDSGYRREGRELWLGEDSAYVVDGSQVERWPAARGDVGCG